MDEKLINELKEKLEADKKSIEKELEAFAKKDDQPKGDWETKYPKYEASEKLNLEEESNELQEYDNLLPVEYSLELKLKNINNALEKIAQKKYGVCEVCGKEITEERLRACPEAKICLNCDEK
jgi:RNA polymerase-binding transcription factor DksA